MWVKVCSGNGGESYGKWMKDRKEEMIDKQLNVGGNPLDDKIKQPSYVNTKRTRMSNCSFNKKNNLKT